MGKRGATLQKKGGQNVGQISEEKWGNRKKMGGNRGQKGGKEGEKRAKREQRRCHMGVKIMGKKWATCEVNWGNRGAKKVRES